MLVLGLIDIPLWLILIPAMFALTYWYGTRNLDYWTKRGIPGPKPTPFIGINTKLMKSDIHTLDTECIQTYGKVYGHFRGNTPELFIADHDMITEIAIKQFNNFADRRNQVLTDELVNDGLVSMVGDKWKNVRSKMSPTFTSGKLRVMSTEINRSAKSLATKLKSMKEPFETKHYVEGYTMDCIASTAFGLRTDTQVNEDNEFSKNSRKFVDVNIKSFKMFILALWPRTIVDLLVFLGVDFNLFDKTSGKYFMDIFNQTLEGRQAGENRVDFLQLMVNVYKGKNIDDEENSEHKPTGDSSQMTKKEILANCLIFFLAGFDNVSLGLTNLIYSLACNQECQDKLIEEIKEVVGDKDEITYDVVGKLPYLDQCINEALRIYPPAFRIDRVALRDTTVCGMKIEKGLIIDIPILAIHRDPEIWPEPMKFDPERFSPENKPNIKQAHWMPFGLGPRNCIGMRQALFEIKIAVVEILKTHRFITCDKTEIPLIMSREKIMKAQNGVWLSLEQHSQSPVT